MDGEGGEAIKKGGRAEGQNGRMAKEAQEAEGQIIERPAGPYTNLLFEGSSLQISIDI